MQEHPNQLFTEYATQVLSSIGSEAQVEPNVEVSANQIGKLKLNQLCELLAIYASLAGPYKENTLDIARNTIHVHYVRYICTYFYISCKKSVLRKCYSSNPAKDYMVTCMDVIVAQFQIILMMREITLWISTNLYFYCNTIPLEYCSPEGWAYRPPYLETIPSCLRQLADTTFWASFLLLLAPSMV